jgi:hypothetical protein
LLRIFFAHLLVAWGKRGKSGEGLPGLAGAVRWDVDMVTFL